MPSHPEARSAERIAVPSKVVPLPKVFGTSMSRGGAEHAEKIVRNEHCNWPSAVTAVPRDQVFQLSNFFRASLGLLRD